MKNSVYILRSFARLWNGRICWSGRRDGIKRSEANAIKCSHCSNNCAILAPTSICIHFHRIFSFLWITSWRVAGSCSFFARMLCGFRVDAVERLLRLFYGVVTNATRISTEKSKALAIDDASICFFFSIRYRFVYVWLLLLFFFVMVVFMASECVCPCVQAGHTEAVNRPLPCINVARDNRR